ncbi:MAG: hypothetical protein GEV08_00850 [Acidimicrobiia bacterium]|nr:hypothetical protein [Acidimicrobiia bacterium]
MAGGQRRGGRYTAPGTGSPRAGATGRKPRALSPREAVELREAYAVAFTARGVPAASGDAAWAQQVRAVLAESAVGLARAGFSDEQAVDLVVHGYSGHVDQAGPSAVRAQLRHYTRDIISGRHGH